MDARFVVGLGEVLWDLFPKGKRLGGAPANFAYHAAQFGHEGLVVSAIGLKMVILTKGINQRRPLERRPWPTSSICASGT